MQDFGYTSFVSEWAPIMDYASADQHEPHRWFRIGRYDGRDIPGWGNLLFVPHGRERDFERALNAARRAHVRRLVAKRLPWLRPVYRKVKAARLRR